MRLPPDLLEDESKGTEEVRTVGFRVYGRRPTSNSRPPVGVSSDLALDRHVRWTERTLRTHGTEELKKNLDIENGPVKTCR